mgnify:CR=1 FL=1
MDKLQELFDEIAEAGIKATWKDNGTVVISGHWVANCSSIQEAELFFTAFACGICAYKRTIGDNSIAQPIHQIHGIFWRES